MVSHIETMVRASVAGCTYDVVAIRYGTCTTPARELFHRYEVFGEPNAPVEMHYYFWVLRGGGRTILVDTGFAPPAGTRRDRICLISPVDALRALGIHSRAVTHVIVTHFHYDHVGNVDEFPDAELLFARAEFDFWTSPMAMKEHFASLVESREVEAVVRAHREGRARFVEYPAEILPGVVAIPVGGHTPGQLVVVAAQESGHAILTSDAVHFYAELQLDRPFSILHDLSEMYAGYETIRAIAAERNRVVVAGHDPAVMTKFPPASTNSAGFAVRIS